RTRRLDIDYSSDGSVEILEAAPLEGIREAVVPSPLPQGADDAPTAIVVDASAVAAKPVLGVAVSAGKTSYAGPTLWLHAAADPRTGARPLAARAVTATDGAIGIDLEEKQLAAAARAGALVVIVAP